MKCLRLIKENGFTVNYSILNFLILHYGPKKDNILNLTFDRKILLITKLLLGELLINITVLFYFIIQ